MKRQHVKRHGQLQNRTFHDGVEQFNIVEMNIICEVSVRFGLEIKIAVIATLGK